MTHSEFRIGEGFWCGDRRWRCTDIGTRVIVAICLEPHEIREIHTDRDGTRTEPLRVIDDDSSWFTGPPYAVSEEVFDEEDVVGCTLAREQ